MLDFFFFCFGRVGCASRSDTHTHRLLLLLLLEAQGAEEEVGWWLSGNRDVLARGYARCMNELLGNVPTEMWELEHM